MNNDVHRTKCNDCGKSLIGIMTYPEYLCNDCYAKKFKNKPRPAGSKKLRSHVILFIILLALSILGIIELCTLEYVAEKYEINNYGIVSYYIGQPCMHIFGLEVAAIAMTVVGSVCRLVFLWIGMAIYELVQINKLRKKFKKSHR